MNTLTFLQCASAVAAFTLSNVAWSAVSRHEYDTLIMDARAGNYEPALAMLRQHAIDHPQDIQAAYDHVLIASWANRSNEAIIAYEALQPEPNRPPANVLEAVARAYRDTQRWDAAVTHYHNGRRLYPSQVRFAVGEVKTLADAGQRDSAVQQGQALVEEQPANADARLALSYALKSASSPYAALFETSQAHSLAPRQAYVSREYLNSLENAGLAHAALETARQHQDLVDASRMRKLQADYLAELSRLAETPVRQESERYVLADRAITEYDKLIPAWQALGDEAKADVRRLQIDRLQALAVRGRSADAVASYEALVTQGVQIPPYALRHVAASYLALRQPEKARNLYRQVVSAKASQHSNPAEKLSNQFGLYYSLIENEEFAEAGRVMETAQAGQPTWRHIKGVPQRVPNDLHMYSEQTGALGLFYEDNTPAAQERLEELVDNAPINVGLRTALANVYLSRGWPRRAEKQLKVAEALEPRSPEMEAMQGMTALDLREWKQAEILLDDLLARYPERPSTQHLEREWKLHQKAELRIQANGGIASDSPVTGSNDLSMETVLYSAPLHHNWRAFGGAGYATGDFEEGSGSHRWLLAGIEWRGRDLTGELEISSHNYGFGTKPGARVSAAYDLNDQWQVGASIALRSSETPLRALRNGVYANGAGAYVRWRQSDYRDWSLSLSALDFSDGNNRLTAVLSGRERLYASPSLKADLLIGVAASRNTHESAAYFNPQSDLELLPSLRLTHTLYRHYDTTLEHSLMLGAGLYAQQHYDTGAIGVASYGMKYRHDDVFEIGATVMGVSRPYDGVRERELRFMLEMTLRF
ncbi:poly-beta-1,6 N-acetyl-D-glucosamine export porin PgaA [Pollutimonas harenae]|uniref:Poly-beta-1,6 N-acetyl-D-glucosamine export porin PgaA n=1 Tax=Pollutimonas harenae TaxID=657015 RepID=A0A853H298_9BURK|nr:poly-beta-1,6 N-acetyl-D-glucosamine export porin PgaA [Pollutimonas harenae]NYT85929.1 poly-beta-1,6 N-acetyl-D-glucosamine export porin PgaA [Pollutimonas harenae]TEA70981.1 poly-beta-1,6 N-acetyl-D-glucosamine export porin PgaA [Pollutimonas harenae]